MLSTLSASAVRVDVSDDDVGSPTQAGWTAADASGINNVTFAPVGEVTVDDRDRTDNGGGISSLLPAGILPPKVWTSR